MKLQNSSLVKLLGNGTKEGDSPVNKKLESSESIPSTTGHEKSAGNLGGPPSKAKYDLVTDSEQVP